MRDAAQIVSVNVRGLITGEKRVKIYDRLTAIKVDIALLQETHYVEKNEVKYNSRWFGKAYHCYSDSTFSRGVSILLRKDLHVEVTNTHRSIDGRKILLNLKIEDNSASITIVNVYAPNIDQNRIDFFKKKLNGFIRNYALSTDNIVLCGDLNCCKER